MARRLSSPLPDRQSARPLTVSELAHRILRALESDVGQVSVLGEVSGVRIPASGHCYFTLKDAQAAINAVCFKSTLKRTALLPADGMQLEVGGRVTAYTPRSEYQIVVSSMREAGLGVLMRRFMELKEKLRKEGLFDEALKRPIPRLPRAIGLVTSSTGAALRDILNVLGRRARGLHLYLSPTAVQGEAAPLEIVAALERLQRHGQAEVIIATRGGGSIEDLWAFNDERVVRAIAACPVPVISAVGHETDTTLSDYAADLRAPTPSAAAELVSAHYGELTDQLRRLARLLDRSMRQRLLDARIRLDRYRSSWGMRTPIERLNFAMQRLDDLREALRRATSHARVQRRDHLRELSDRLARAIPARRLQVMHERLARARDRLLAAGAPRWRPRLAANRSLADQYSRRLAAATINLQCRRRLTLNALGERLHAAGPDAVLQRGYSIVTHGRRDRVLTDPQTLRVGEVVRVRSAKGPWKAGVLPPGDDMFEGR